MCIKVIEDITYIRFFQYLDLRLYILILSNFKLKMR